MMIQRNFVIYEILLLCVTVITGAGLVNDTCHEVWIREDITKKAAQVVCHETARVYDNKSQNGSYLMEDTENWAGEIFACLCSCQLPFELQNGQILSKHGIHHGETLNYSCNDGYEKKIEKKIRCYDGLLMTVPDYLEMKNIDLFSRQKSLTHRFANQFVGKVFDLWVNKSANFSIPETELQNNQKVFHILTENETVLQYYICSGKGCMLGYISFKKEELVGVSLGSKGLECIKMNNATSTTSSSNLGQEQWVLPVIVTVVGVVVVTILTISLYVIWRRKNKNKNKGEQQEIDEGSHDPQEQIPLSGQISQPSEEAI